MNGIQKIIKIAAVCLAIFIILSIINGILWLASSFTDFEVGDQEFSETYQNITELDIDLSASSIQIQEGDNFSVIAHNVTNSFKSRESYGVLKIKENSNWFFNNKNGGEILITIPANIKLNKLDIDAGAGKINISEIKSIKFDLDQGAGVIEINNSSFDKSDIDGGAGSMKINTSILNDLDLDAGVGEIIINGEITGNSKISCGVGKLELNLSDESLYTITAEKGLGSININGMDYKNETTYGTGINKIHLEGGVGSINVNFF